MRKTWTPFVQIYFDLLRFDTSMKQSREAMSGRGVGRPKESTLKSSDPKVAAFFEEIRKRRLEEVSSWAWPEFYLRCSCYRKGGEQLLKWCEEHLQSKDGTKEWGFALDRDNITYLGKVLDNPMFLNKHEYNKYLHVHGRKVFSNPFSHILERAWVWNSAMEYSLEVCTNLGIKGPRLLALRSCLYQVVPEVDIHTEEELRQVLIGEQGLKRVSGYDTATKQIQRAKRFISKKLK
jgi:hypothetical protein